MATGEAPAKAVERLRLEAASSMLEEARHPVNVVAIETGFGDRERMRRAGAPVAELMLAARFAFAA